MKKKKEETELEAIRNIFPIVESYENYFSKQKSSLTAFVELKRVAVKDLLALNFFGRKLTLNEVGLVVGCSRWNVSILDKEEITKKQKRLLKKCVKNSLYPVSLNKEEKAKNKKRDYKLTFIQ